MKVSAGQRVVLLFVVKTKITESLRSNRSGIIKEKSRQKRNSSRKKPDKRNEMRPWRKVRRNLS
jgi:hypothetical protein